MTPSISFHLGSSRQLKILKNFSFFPLDSCSQLVSLDLCIKIIRFNEQLIPAKTQHCNEVPIRASHSWYFCCCIGMKFTTHVILLYEKLETLRDDTIA